MESMVGILERKEAPEQLGTLLNAEMRMMKDNHGCQKKELASTVEGNIFLCRCGIYHIQMNNTTLYLNEAQFNATARLFKLALGVRVGHRLYPEPIYSGMGAERKTAESKVA